MQLGKAVRITNGILSGILFIAFTAALIATFNIGNILRATGKKLAEQSIDKAFDRSLGFTDSLDPGIRQYEVLKTVAPGAAEKAGQSISRLGSEIKVADRDSLKARISLEIDRLFASLKASRIALREFYRNENENFPEAFDRKRAMTERSYVSGWVMIRFVEITTGFFLQLRVNLAAQAVFYLSIFVLAFYKGHERNIYPLIFMVASTVLAVCLLVTDPDLVNRILSVETALWKPLSFYALMLSWVCIPALMTSKKVQV